MENKIKKIVFIGPESSGKTTLCKQLANHFNTLFVEEYAREYLLTNGKEYTYEDLIKIAAGQIKKEEEAINNLINTKTTSTNSNQLLFIDTDMYVMKVWSEVVFNKCDLSILNTIATRKYDLYLLCEPDIPWVKDDLREYPDGEIRTALYQHYKELMTEQQTPWININGNFEERTAIAKNAILQLFQ